MSPLTFLKWNYFYNIPVLCDDDDNLLQPDEQMQKMDDQEQSAAQHNPLQHKNIYQLQSVMSDNPSLNLTKE